MDLLNSLINLYNTDYKTLLKGVLCVHIFLLSVIFIQYVKNPKSIHYSITRLQLILLIISLWIFIMINNNDLKEKYNDY